MCSIAASSSPVTGLFHPFGWPCSSRYCSTVQSTAKMKTPENADPKTKAKTNYATKTTVSYTDSLKLLFFNSLDVRVNDYTIFDN